MNDQTDPLLVAFDRFVTAVDWSDPRITFVEAFTEAVTDWMAQRAAATDTEVPWRNESDDTQLFNVVQDLNEFVRATNYTDLPTPSEQALAEALLDWVCTNQRDDSAVG